MAGARVLASHVAEARQWGGSTVSDQGAGLGLVASSGAARPVAPPAWLLVVGGGLVVLAGALVPVGVISVHWIGYVLSTFVNVALVARFRALDQRLRENPFYTPMPVLRTVASGLLLTTYLVAAVHAWLLATHYA